MARKKKTALTIDEQISEVKIQIDSLAEQLKEKKAELKSLEMIKEDEYRSKIIDAIAQSGKSYDEILEMLNK